MKRNRWLFVWLIQIVAMSLIGGIVSLSLWLNYGLYAVCMWAVYPILGAVSAYCATIKGLLNYVAWIAPAVTLALVHLALWSNLPDTGPVLVCAFISLVGAAAGEVVVQSRKHD